MKSFLQFTEESLIEAYWDTYYSDWGFIRQNGKVERAPKGFKAPMGDGAAHEILAEKLGFEDVDDALTHGLVRFLVTRDSGRAVFGCFAKYAKAISKYLLAPKVPITTVDVEYISGGRENETRFPDIKSALQSLP